MFFLPNVTTSTVPAPSQNSTKMKNPSSLVCMKLWSQTLRCAWNQEVRLCSVHETGESDSVVCMNTGSQTLRCAWNCGVRLCGAHDTVEADSAVRMDLGVRLCGVHETVESDSEAGLGIRSFQKNGTIFAFFSVLYKRTEQSLRSFPFFIKERNVLFGFISHAKIANLA